MFWFSNSTPEKKKESSTASFFSSHSFTCCLELAHVGASLISCLWFHVGGLIKWSTLTVKPFASRVAGGTDTYGDDAVPKGSPQLQHCTKPVNFNKRSVTYIAVHKCTIHHLNSISLSFSFFPSFILITVFLLLYSVFLFLFF